MTQALYAHMNNKKIKIKKRGGVGVLQRINYMIREQNIKTFSVWLYFNQTERKKE
jgi:hypothetical protein